MKLAIMQPYFLPYIGYFQLMNAVDEFIVYDNIQFTKKGWINRNRFLVNGKDSFISIPLKKDSDFLDVKDRYLSDTWIQERSRILNRLVESYRKSPNFDLAFPVIEKCIYFEDNNLFKFIFNSLNLIKEYLEIQTTLLVSSSISIDHKLKGEDKVLALCKARNARSYFNPIGGTTLYSKEKFGSEDVELKFLKADNVAYKQFENIFVPFLSILDVMMFNTKEEVKKSLHLFTIQ